MNRTIMLIKQAMTEKKRSETFVVPKRWKMRQPSELEKREVSLTGEQQTWLENHEQSHARREFLAVIRGSAVLRMDRHPILLKQGEFLAIDPWVWHTVGHLPDDSSVYWWCQIGRAHV